MESLQKEVLHIVIALLVLFISIPYIYRSYHVSKAEGTESENGEENEEQILLPSATQVGHLIKKRRSIFPKDMKPEGNVPDDVIREILEAANWAPTHGKTEPWRFVVLRDFEEMQRIKLESSEASMKDDPEKLQAFRDKFQKKAKELKNVSAMVVIITKRVTNAKGNLMPEWEEIAATSCAVQNMHLALTAHWEKGYGGYWSSGGYDAWLNSDDMRKYCGADGSVDGEDDKILGVFFLGQSEVSKMEMYRASRKPIDKKVVWK